MAFQAWVASGRLWAQLLLRSPQARCRGVIVHAFFRGRAVGSLCDLFRAISPRRQTAQLPAFLRLLTPNLAAVRKNQSMGGEAAGGFDYPPWVSQIYQSINKLFVIGLLIFPVALAACTSERRGDQAQSLEERVRGFWEARIAGDDLKAYAYEAYAKTGKMTPTQYVRARSPVFQYRAYTVKGIEEQQDEATVTIDLRYSLALPTKKDVKLSMNLQERWVRLDGQWYRQVEKPETEHASG